MSRLCHRSITGLAIALASACTSVDADDPFPKASPAEGGMSAEAIVLLSDHVSELVEKEAAVGGELHIIKGRKTVLHRAYGWADREERRSLETDSIYCVRSMTKPLVGTAIQMLIDDGKLSLGQRVSEILTEFDKPETDAITIEHLLTHTSGLPMSAIRRPLSEYRTLRDVAADAAEAGIDFEPGTSFQYSDAGSDTLGAVVAVVSGAPTEEFVRDRILRPLDMEDTLTLLDRDERAKRVPNAYSGATGNWQRHWRPSDQPIFPLFLTSQSLYCTTTDYARFLTLWMDGGELDGRTLISREAVSRAISPGWPIREYPTGFEKLRLTYGQQWMVYHGEDSREPVIFGHGGSDGTHVWAWPKQDLIVLFFTQSRGTLAGVELEATIDRLLIQNDVDGYRRDKLARQAAVASYQQYEGIYWDEDAEADYYVVKVDKDKLVFERPGRLRAVARPLPDGKFTIGRSLKLEFENANNPAAAMLMTTTKRTERQVRHQPDAGLPTLASVIEKVRTAHGVDSLKDSGIIKLSGTIQMGPLGLKGKIHQWIDSRRSRVEIQMGARSMMVITNGDEAAATGRSGAVERMDGIARQQEVIAHPAIQFGGWQQGYTQLDVIKAIQPKNGVPKNALLVRAKTPDMPGATLIVDTETGFVVGDKRIQFIGGMGFVGVESRYSDFREVAGVTLPFRIDSRHANPLIGKMIISFDESESGISPSDLFDLPTD